MCSFTEAILSSCPAAFFSIITISSCCFHLVYLHVIISVALVGRISDVEEPTPAELEASGLRMNSAGEIEEAPLLPRRHRSLLRPSAEDVLPRSAARMLRGLSSREAEDDALLEEQARGLLDAGAAARGGGSGGSVRRPTGDLSGDDSSDWGGDPLDLRFEQVRSIVRRHRCRRCLPPFMPLMHMPVPMLYCSHYTTTTPTYCLCQHCALSVIWISPFLPPSHELCLLLCHYRFCAC